MGLIEEYESYFNIYKTRYGSHIVVLYQNGKFHEVYGLDNALEKVGNVSEIADIIGIKETRRDSKILENSRNNCQMAGFNSVSLDENVDKLVNYGYTVIVINQIPDSKPIRRDVAYIKSPSTNVNTKTQKDPYLVSIYVNSSYNKNAQRAYQYIGMSAIDVTTGNNYVFESNSTPSDPSLAGDELIRFLQTFNPVEVILNQNSSVHDNCRLDNDIIKLWGYKPKDESEALYNITDMKPTVYIDTEESRNYQLPFQEDFLCKIFDKHRGSISAIEYLELEKYTAARASYIYMLQFCISHNSELLNSINGPSYWQSGQNLILDTSSILQLNIIESYYNQQRQASVYDMLSRYVQTPMGRRMLRDRLLNPIVDQTILNLRYNNIETMNTIIEHIPSTIELIQKSQLTKIVLYEYIKDALNGIRDLDRLHRKIALIILTPAELHTLDGCYEKIIMLFTKLQQYNLYSELTVDIDKLVFFRKKYNDIINITDAGCCTVTEHIQDSIFKVGYNINIDNLSADIRKDQKIIQVLCQKLSDLVAKSSTHCKYKEDSIGDGGCYCSLTKPQYKKLQDGLKTSIDTTIDGVNYTISIKDLHVDDRNKTNVKIKIKLFDNLYENIQINISKLRLLSIQIYKEMLVKLTSDLTTLNTISKSVGEIDLYRSLAYHVIKYKYCKPIINSDTTIEQGSSLQTCGLRHPLIERNNVYVAQDISLNSESTGILLYGVNQSGKSCTMKSIGIAVIMAQAGMYVAADSFEYVPYTTLMTRILGNDNADKGLSTFAVEMMELRSILTRNNNRTLVLGDELCHGTESASAVSLVAASIMHLSASSTSFIFATHLHELSTMDEIITLNNVNQYHLTISFDPDNSETIIYNRLMKKGSGTGLYGIEVAKHLKIPQSVVEKAYSIRNKYYNKATECSKSSYNSAVVVNKCKIPQCSNIATETHHIMFQSESDKNGFIGAVHKNNEKNLVPLCDMHHDMVHQGIDDKELVIFGYGIDGRINCETRKIIKSLNCNQIICPRYIRHPIDV